MNLLPIISSCSPILQSISMIDFISWSYTIWPLIEFFLALNFIWVQRNESERKNNDFSWNPSWIKFIFVFLYIKLIYISFLVRIITSKMKSRVICFNISIMLLFMTYQMNDLDNNNPMEKYLIIYSKIIAFEFFFVQ